MKFKLRESLSLTEDRGFREVHVNKDGTLTDTEGKPFALSANPNFKNSFGSFANLNDDDIVDLSKYNPADEVKQDWAASSGNDEEDTGEEEDKGNSEGKGRAGNKMGKSGRDSDSDQEDSDEDGGDSDKESNKDSDRDGDGNGNGKGKGKGENIFKLIIKRTQEIFLQLKTLEDSKQLQIDFTKLQSLGQAVIDKAQQSLGLVEGAEQGQIEDSTLDDIWDLKDVLKLNIDSFNAELEVSVINSSLQSQEITTIAKKVKSLYNLKNQLDEVVIGIQEKIFDFHPDKCYTYIDEDTGDEYIKFGDDYVNIEDYYEMRGK